METTSNQNREHLHWLQNCQDMKYASPGPVRQDWKILADYCERKILFQQDVNSDSVSWLASQPAGLKPAEHAQFIAESSTVPY